jgi:hypothetical protein
MSGPDYPPGPQPGSNAIGQFVIGTSPIGSIPSTAYWQTIISQYANSPTLTQLITNFFQYIDQQTNIDAFFDMVWNVDTAQGWGLDVWGRIVGVVRTLHVQNAGNYAGFSEQGVGADDFSPGGLSPFYLGGPLTNNFALTDPAFRTLIYAKALANISDGSMKAINQLLVNLFPNRGNCYVTDGGNMTMTYTFKFALTPVEAAIVQTSGILPKPVGVSATVVQDF